MSTLALSDRRALASPIADERPSGDALEYDPLFVAMELAASGREEQQFGQTVIEEQPPQWEAVRGLAMDLCQRTHDLRVGVYLAEAVLESEGLSGFTDCLELLAVWLKNEWETVHPQLDAEDHWDPTLRLNTLTRLTDSRRILQRLRAIPLTEVRGLGTVTIGGLAILSDPKKAESEAFKSTEATLSGGPVEPLLEASAAMQRTLKAVRDLDRAVAERVGVARSVEFDPLVKVLKQAISPLADRLQRLGVRNDPASEARPAELRTAAPPKSNIMADIPQENRPVETPSAPRASPCDWSIRTRDDVTHALDRICDYFARHEPSSPIPLLLGRAKRLVPMGFLEILQELGPDFLAQAQRQPGNAAVSR
ncbi:MAG: type VI secretion system protein TssA [Planctomycetaceae bacterium]|nr:type VI secretion system protein TssA [Planctomycetaceae bacterium]